MLTDTVAESLFAAYTVGGLAALRAMKPAELEIKEDTFGCEISGKDRSIRLCLTANATILPSPEGGPESPSHAHILQSVALNHAILNEFNARGAGSAMVMLWEKKVLAGVDIGNVAISDIGRNGFTALCGGEAKISIRVEAKRSS